eukprot:TRINITY_DN20879_c0_g1_i2.p1 TRINITY_DN20879_c0_g1~~TRINITY_DN20879_c0_g1_i2.p1  ORF type:complete len:480 (+),score=124.14 TRINITY_DN20879_c0_g1_i2:180-1442(+)
MSYPPIAGGEATPTPAVGQQACFWGRGMAATNRLEGIQKALWEYSNAHCDQRDLVAKLFPYSLCCFDEARHPNVAGHVALTIDDCPGRLGRKATLLPELRRLFRRHDARATLFVMSDYVRGHESELAKLCADGCELQNHGADDRSYYWDSEADFEACVKQSEAILDHFGVPARRWYRAPKGMLSSTMREVLGRRGYQNVMFDRYALDTEVGDSEWIAERLLEGVASGSVLLVHLPERGFREWCLEALARLLKGLDERGLRAVTVSELAALAESQVVDDGDGDGAEGDTEGEEDGEDSADPASVAGAAAPTPAAAVGAAAPASSQVRFAAPPMFSGVPAAMPSAIYGACAMAMAGAKVPAPSSARPVDSASGVSTPKAPEDAEVCGDLNKEKAKAAGARGKGAKASSSGRKRATARPCFCC